MLTEHGRWKVMSDPAAPRLVPRPCRWRVSAPPRPVVVIVITAVTLAKHGGRPDDARPGRRRIAAYTGCNLEPRQATKKRVREYVLRHVLLVERVRDYVPRPLVGREMFDSWSNAVESVYVGGLEASLIGRREVASPVWWLDVVQKDHELGQSAEQVGDLTLDL